MARKPRIVEAGLVYHVYNRRTDRQTLLPSPRAYDGFLELIETGRRRYRVSIVGYCAMRTHWHQALWVKPEHGPTAMADYLRWLSTTHAIRVRRDSGTRGDGHVYQDRYKSVAVYEEDHYFTLMRYIERNPLGARLVERAEHWPWSSLYDRLNNRRRILDEGPLPLPANWIDIVNAPGDLDLFEAIAKSAMRES